MSKPSLRGNIVSMIFWQLGNYVIPLLTFPYLTRVLGVAHFGIYALAFATTSYFCLLVDWGFLLGAPGKIARVGDDLAQLNDIFWSTFFAKLLLMLATLPVIGIAILVSPGVRAMAPVLLCSYGMVLANIITVNWCLQGLERLDRLATASMIGRGLTVPATFLLVHGSGDTWIAALIQSGGAMITGIASIVLLRKLNVIRRPSTTPSTLWHAAWTQIRETWPLFLSALSSNLYTSTNTVMLGMLRGPVDTGLFSSADRLRSAAQATIAPISHAVYPRASRLMADDPDSAMALARRLLLLQGAFTFCIAAVLMVGAPTIIHMLAGPKFEQSVPVLRLLAPIPFLVGLANVFGIQLMLPLGMHRMFSRITTAAALLDLLIVVPLSWYFGAPGTAAAALVTEGFVVVTMGVVLIRADVPLFQAPRAGLRA